MSAPSTCTSRLRRPLATSRRSCPGASTTSTPRWRGRRGGSTTPRRAPRRPYFLDKTPRYYFIAEDLLRIFPDAKVVFLWRNPLAVVASLLETFRRGRFEPYYFRSDLYLGPRLLVDAFRAAGDRAFSVRFEELVSPDGEGRWRDLFEHLELDFDPAYLRGFEEVRLKGNYQDPVGQSRYRELSSEPLDKWRGTLRGPVRRAWARRYLRGVGADTLEAMGYDQAALLTELETAPGGQPAAADAARLALSWWRAAVIATALRVPENIGPLGDRYREDARGVVAPVAAALRERRRAVGLSSGCGRQRAQAHGAPTRRITKPKNAPRRPSSRSRPGCRSPAPSAGAIPSPNGVKKGPPDSSSWNPAASSIRRWPALLGVHQRGLPSPSEHRGRVRRVRDARPQRDHVVREELTPDDRAHGGECLDGIAEVEHQGAHVHEVEVPELLR